ncbi:hypothetical protein AtNW77_Chr5g0153621 [Arabidopsis thaliana]
MTIRSKSKGYRHEIKSTCTDSNTLFSKEKVDFCFLEMTIRSKSKGCLQEIKSTCADSNTLFSKGIFLPYLCFSLFYFLIYILLEFWAKSTSFYMVC